MRVVSDLGIPIIESQFNGPPHSAQGGYACGLFAGLITPGERAAAAVTLLSPPPMDTPLEFHRGERRSQIRLAGELIATVTEVAGEPTGTDPLSPAEAEQAARGFRGFTGHPFPTCFVCGHARPAADGLALTPGPVEGRPGTVACLWTPADDQADADGRVRDEIVWSVLDCPGGWTGDPVHEPMVLSRMTAVITRPPTPGHTCVVVGTLRRKNARTSSVDTAVFDASQQLLGKASAVWTAVPDGLPSAG